MEKKEEQKEKQKPRYGMCSNTLYMIRRAWRDGKSVPVLALLTVVLGISMSLLQLFAVPVILGKIEARESLEETVLSILFFALGMLIIGGLSAYIDQNTLFGRITVRTGVTMDMHDKMCCTSYVNRDKTKFKDLTQAAQDAVWGNEGGAEKIWDTLAGLLKSCIGFGVYLLFMVRLEWWIIVLTTATAAVGYLMTLRANRWFYKHQEEGGDIYKNLNYLNARVQDRVFAKDVRIFGMEKWLKDTFEKKIKELFRFYRIEQSKYVQRELAGVVMTFLRNAVAYGYLIGEVLKSSMGVAEFLLYFSAVSGFTAWVEGILTGVAELHKESQEISTAREYLEYEEPFLFEEGKALEPVQGVAYEIELRDVSFRYPEAEADTVSHLNLKIHKGEKLALVGLNGAGKTTLVKLMCGFYDPTEGQVLLNGQDIRQYNRRDYYRHFSAVFQDFSVLAGSIAMNVAQTDQDICMDLVKACVEKAGLKKKVESLPESYHTNLGKDVYEDAVELSGGEVQRLMLARALYKGAPIVVLDEPTAALDPLAERDLYQRYHELVGESTSVYISHRLASTRFCDRVVMLEKGRIIEEGSHEELLAANGEYAHLYDVQSHYYREDAKQTEGGEQNAG